MGKNQSASNLTNIVKQDTNGNISFVSGSTTLMSVSSSGAIATTGNVAGTASYASNAELLDGLDSTVFTLTSSFAAQTASFTAFTASQNILNGTYATTGSNTFKGSQYISSSFVPTNFTDTASLYTDGGMRVTKNAYLSSSLYIAGDLTVFGTQSVNYITSSQLNIATNIITVNTSTPAVRFGGIAVQDSGSLASGLTGSLLWDSQNNHWIYTNPSGSSYSGGMLISGPRNTGSMGDEQGTTFNAIMKGMGGDHITSSGIFEVSGSVGIGTTNPTSPLSLYYASTASDINYIKMEMPSWGGSINYKKNIIWHDSGNVVGGIGMAFTSPYTYMDFHSFYNGAHTTGSLMRIQGNGNIGIGTTSPSKLLHLYNTAATDVMLVESTQVFSTLAFKSSTNSSTVTVGIDGAGNAAFENKLTTGAMAFVTNGNERMRITAAGNIGVGTTSATSSYGFSRSLVVSNPANAEISLAATTSGKVLSMGVTDGMNYFQTTSGNGYNFQTGGTSRVTIESGGKVVAPYGYQSFKGNITLTAGNTGTIYTMAADGLYTVYVRFYGASGIFMASSIVTSLFTNGESFIASIKTASNVGISVSGNNIQVGNGGFATYTFQWSILYQSVDF